MAYIKLPVSKHLPGFMALGKQDLNSWLATPKPISPQVHWLPLAKSNETMYFGKKERAIIQTSSENRGAQLPQIIISPHTNVFFIVRNREIKHHFLYHFQLSLAQLGCILLGPASGYSAKERWGVVYVLIRKKRGGLLVTKRKPSNNLTSLFLRCWLQLGS